MCFHRHFLFSQFSCHDYHCQWRWMIQMLVLSKWRRMRWSKWRQCSGCLGHLGVATNCFLLNATVSHDIDHFIIANAIVIIISYPSPHTSFIQLIDLLRSWNSCFSRLEVPHFGRERPTLVHMHVPPPTSDARRPDFPILADSQTRSIGPLSSSLTFHSQWTPSILYPLSLWESPFHSQ